MSVTKNIVVEHLHKGIVEYEKPYVVRFALIDSKWVYAKYNAKDEMITNIVRSSEMEVEKELNCGEEIIYSEKDKLVRIYTKDYIELRFKKEVPK